MLKQKISAYSILLGDQSLILGQRLGELCGHGPILEVDIAMTNIALDLLGQARLYYQLAAELSDTYEDEDQIAFLRREKDYNNCVLVEMPNGDFGDTIVRQYLFDVYHLMFLNQLKESNEKRLKAIAEKSIKEVRYHLNFSGDWILRLGKGTEVSNQKIQKAVDTLWPYTKELVQSSELETEMHGFGIAPNLADLEDEYYRQVKSKFAEAEIKLPEDKWSQIQGKKGLHSEHFGYLLSDLQYLQRSYPNSKW